MCQAFTKLLILFIFLPLFSFSQNNFVFQHITVDDGLLSNSIVNTFQDSEGFYWFSTVDGIQRFDGKNFITYTYNNNATKNTDGDWVGKPLEDKEKNIWILNDDGINIYQRKHETIRRLYLSDAADSSRNNVCTIIKDRLDNIWIITAKNIFRYDYKMRKAIIFAKIIIEPNSSVAAAIIDNKTNNFWLLISKSGLYKIASFDVAKNKIFYLNFNFEPTYINFFWQKQ